jgi:hypothetical protein
MTNAQLLLQPPPLADSSLTKPASSLRPCSSPIKHSGNNSYYGNRGDSLNDASQLYYISPYQIFTPSNETQAQPSSTGWYSLRSSWTPHFYGSEDVFPRSKEQANRYYEYLTNIKTPPFWRTLQTVIRHYIKPRDHTICGSSHNCVNKF